MNTYRITLKIKLKKVEKQGNTAEENSHHQHHHNQNYRSSPVPPTYSEVFSHNRRLSHASAYKFKTSPSVDARSGTNNNTTAAEKRVAILGSGPGGIVSAKYALEHGLKPVVFEKKSGPGGLWSSNTAIWDGMHTNVSKYSVMFGDFPWPKDSNVIPSAADVYNYLLNYIRHFKLEKYFRLNSHVTSVRQLPNKKWEVNW
jgi:hypothetical protein